MFMFGTLSSMAPPPYADPWTLISGAVDTAIADAPDVDDFPGWVGVAGWVESDDTPWHPVDTSPAPLSGLVAGFPQGDLTSPLGFLLAMPDAYSLAGLTPGDSRGIARRMQTNGLSPGHFHSPSIRSAWLGVFPSDLGWVSRIAAGSAPLPLPSEIAAFQLMSPPTPIPMLMPSAPTPSPMRRILRGIATLPTPLRESASAYALRRGVLSLARAGAVRPWQLVRPIPRRPRRALSDQGGLRAWGPIGSGASHSTLMLSVDLTAAFM